MSHRSEKSGNGNNQPVDVADVRAIATGTLIFNLIRYATEEIGLENAMHQIEFMKEQQKAVSFPPQYEAIKKALADIQERRYIIANEINKRFAKLDAERRAEVGIEIVTPGDVATTVANMMKAAPTEESAEAPASLGPEPTRES